MADKQVHMSLRLLIFCPEKEAYDTKQYLRNWALLLNERQAVRTEFFLQCFVNFTVFVPDGVYLLGMLN
jgi:hypothetical protein